MTDPALPASPAGHGEPVVILKIARRSRHPWIYRRMIVKPDRPLPAGAIVRIVDRDGKMAGRGHYHPTSQIALRVLTDRDEAVDLGFFRRRLEAAVRLRRDVLRLDDVTDAWRIVHSEADGLSGLIVDRYGSTIVMEFHSRAMHAWRAEWETLLREAFPGATVIGRAGARVEQREEFRCEPLPEGKPVTITESGLKFLVDPGGGHKTGFFIDQRDTRRALTPLVRGRRVLDCCCYTGAFSIYAAGPGGAKEVVGVDLDEKAIARARDNARLNGSRVNWVHSDVFGYLRGRGPDAPKFDVVILDPPKWIGSKEEFPEGYRNHADMNRLALGVLAPGGLLVTCTCSGLMGEEEFTGLVHRAASQAGRRLQLLERRGAAPDHPVAMDCPETRYLQVMILRAEVD